MWTVYCWIHTSQNVEKSLPYIIGILNSFPTN